VPLLILRQVTAHLEKMKLPTKQSGITGDSSRLGSDDTARRPPSVKASLSVSFGQRAPHRASTRGSSPVRKTLPSIRERERSHDGDHAKSPPRKHRSQSRELSRDIERDRSDRDRDRGRYKDREHGRRSHDVRDRDYHRSSYSERDVDRRGRDRRDRDSDRNGRSSSRRSRSRSRSPSRGRTNGDSHRSSPFGKAPESSNLAKLKDLYGDATNAKDDAGDTRAHRDSGAEEVIRLGGARWR
jgi:pre-mRNA-splicing factor 38B